MKKILFSVMTIGAVAAIVVGGTMAFYSDSEESIGNTFSVGEIDLKIDLQCDYEVGCGFPLQDLYGDQLFDYTDIKPGDSDSIAISWHVYNNNAWARLVFDGIKDFEYGCTEAESDDDDTCDIVGDGQGELSQYLNMSIWSDEGSVAGWQCAENSPKCAGDPLEGDYIINGLETLIVDNAPLSSLSEVVLPFEIIASNTYYIGVQWTIPADTGNIIQSDKVKGNIILQVVQSENNPEKIFP